MILSNIQKEQIAHRETSESNIQQQLDFFVKGFPPINLIRPATVNDGIVHFDQNEITEMINLYEIQSVNKHIVKFVPASGAATRMFKSLFEYIRDTNKNKKNSPDHALIQLFFYNLKKFAFHQDLLEEAKIKRINIKEPIQNGDQDLLIQLLLNSDGLNYGNLPKGLLKFHQYKTGSRTAFEEHIAEAILYAKGKNGLDLHFTISQEHHQLFLSLANEIVSSYEKKFQVNIKIGFSFQKPSTDTISVDQHGNPVSTPEGLLLFRPGGHGALLENLSDIDADIIFIKNIDNVVPDHLKSDTVTFKKLIAGVLLQTRDKIYKIQELLEKNKSIDFDELNEAHRYISNLTKTDITKPQDQAELINLLKEIVFRPIRVCGMVKNTGEPGGGPFWVKESNGKSSLQIVESSQVDMNKPEQKAIFNQATHFNPVDIVCSTRDYKGEKYNLTRFRDNNTGFITNKSVNGKDIRVQELPGLWNGSMAKWLTIFVEVPISTFNPVKTVNDLIRPEHQGI